MYNCCAAPSFAHPNFFVAVLLLKTSDLFLVHLELNNLGKVNFAHITETGYRQFLNELLQILKV
jgi:hypothetical protein